MEKKGGVITKQDVEYLGNLSKISLTEEEKTQFGKELEKIIYYVSQLSKVSTDKVSPTWHVLPLTNVFREDEVKSDTGREEILGNAPECDDRFFKVPKII